MQCIVDSCESSSKDESEIELKNIIKIFEILYVHYFVLPVGANNEDLLCCWNEYVRWRLMCLPKLPLSSLECTRKKKQFNYWLFNKILFDAGIIIIDCNLKSGKWCTIKYKLYFVHCVLTFPVCICFFWRALEFWNQTCVTRLLRPVIWAILSKSWPSGFESNWKFACNTCNCSSVNVVLTRFALFLWYPSASQPSEKENFKLFM